MTFGEIAAYILSAVLLLVLCRIFYKPLKGVFIMAFHSILGGAGLYICNAILGAVGFGVGVNIVTAAVCGLLGLPGLLLLLLLKLVFGAL